MMADFSIRISAQSVSAVAVAMRCGCPVRPTLLEEGLGLEDGDHRFLALRGDDRRLHPSALDVEDGVGHIALREDRAVLSVGRDGSAGADVGEERVGIECVLGMPYLPPGLQYWVGRSPCVAGML